MTFQKLLRANVGVYAAYPEAIANFATPTSNELNAQFVYTSAEDNMVFDISCALLDDYTLNMADSDTDDTLTICDIGNVSTATFQNYEASLDFFRDRDVDAEGVFNLAFNLFKGVDRPFILIKRIGLPHDDAFASGQTVSMYLFDTDFPTDIVEDASMIRFGARFKPRGAININYELAA